MGKGNQNNKNEGYPKKRNNNKRKRRNQINSYFKDKFDNGSYGKFITGRNESKMYNCNSPNGKDYSKRGWGKKKYNNIKDFFIKFNENKKENNIKDNNKNYEDLLEEIDVVNDDLLNNKESFIDKKDKQTQKDFLNHQLIEEYNISEEKNQEEFINEKIDEADKMKIEISRKNDIIDKLNIKINSLINDNDILNITNNDLIKKNKELENIINQNNKIMEHIKKVNPLIIYIKPTLIGLNNIGATCFMNSTLQCLSQTKELTNVNDK